MVVTHAMDAACSWFCTDPYTGEWDSGASWTNLLKAACAPYSRVSFLGDSMGGAAALCFAELATESVIAFTPQVDLDGCPASVRPDFTVSGRQDLRRRILLACEETSAQVVVHVGQDAYDLEQAALLPESVRVVHHDVDSHLVSVALKAAGKLRRVVLEDLRSVALKEAGKLRRVVLEDFRCGARTPTQCPCPWRVDLWDAAAVELSVRRHGLCHVTDPALPAGCLSTLKEAAAARLAEVLAAVRERRSLGEAAMDFVEAVERDGRRWDVRHGMREPPFDALIAAPPWADAVHALLGASSYLMFAGMVVALGDLGEAAAPTGLVPLRPTKAPSGLHSETWLTAGARGLMRNEGKLYHEVLLGAGAAAGEPQVGWLTEVFLEGDFDGDGVGDDACGWAADGVRQKVWHDGPAREVAWPRQWRVGDVIGCAVDIEAGRMMFSLNGEWVPGTDIDFDAAGLSIYPAVSARGTFALQIPRATWRFAPPADGFAAWADSGLFTRPEAKAQAQGWHRDGEPLWPLSVTGESPLPPHCLNVFVPLVDLDENNGATEFMPASHVLDQDVEGDLTCRMQPRVTAGSAIIFDYRLHHRGGANASGRDRTVLYFTYAASWFRDSSNHLSSRRLFDSPVRGCTSAGVQSAEKGAEI